MPDSFGFALAIIFGEVVPAAICLYGAYWAFAIRRVLADRMYRSHALWLGALGILFAAGGFTTYSDDPIISFAFSMFYIALFVAFFAFIDSTVRVARRSDPLLRRILHWERLRFALWADVGGIVVVIIYSVVDPAFVFGAQGQVVGNIVWTTLGSILFGPGAVALLLGARRSGDPLFRESLKWFGVFLSLVVGVFVVTGIEAGVFGLGQFDIYYSYPALPGAFLFILMAYALYRSSRSLAPMNRLQAVEPATVSPDTVAST